jgi:hypothetical protein
MTQEKPPKTMLKKLKTKITTLQQVFAARLSAFEAGLSIRQKKLLLILFCFSFGLGSTYVVVATLTRRFSGAGLPAAPIRIPYHIGQSFHQPGSVIDAATYRRVEHFKHFLDSLKITSAGRYTEIINTRPHLYDSIVAFEKIYFLQLKK